MSCECFVRCEMCGRFDRFISAAERRIRLLPARCKEEWINCALLHVLFVFVCIKPGVWIRYLFTTRQEKEKLYSSVSSISVRIS